jgi:subtilisin family serine protease
VEASGGEIKNVYKRVYPGFSAELTGTQVQELKANPRVESVIADQAVHSTATQTNPTWGLDRIDQRPTTGDGRYSYDTTGSGVTAYIVDTGIRVSHDQFGTRAVSGYDFVDYDDDATDCNGHGTHVSGTVGGSTYGVAKAVKLVGVRVLDCEGSGTAEGVIAAIDWVTLNSSGPSVLNMSLGGLAYDPIDEAVASATAAGVTVVVSAGNEDDNACDYSPARAPSAITVGATDDTDTRANFSNWGSCVDLFAPGVNVRSAWKGSDSATEYLNGTSMASPHVAGIVARYRQAHPGHSPAQVKAAVLAATTPGEVSDPKGAPGLLVYAAPPAGLPGKTVIKKASSGSKSGKTVSVTGRWSKPTSGGAVTKYYVTAIRKSNGAKKTIAVSSTARSKKITGLKKNAKYVVRVYAKNASGNGPTSKSSNTITAR